MYQNPPVDMLPQIPETDCGSHKMRIETAATATFVPSIVANSGVSRLPIPNPLKQELLPQSRQRENYGTKERVRDSGTY